MKFNGFSGKWVSLSRKNPIRSIQVTFKYGQIVPEQMKWKWKQIKSINGIFENNNHMTSKFFRKSYSEKVMF